MDKNVLLKMIEQHREIVTVGIASVVLSPLVIFTEINKFLDDFIIWAAVVFAIFALLRSIKAKKLVVIYAINAILITIYTGSHYSLALFRASMNVDLIRAIMELELILGATFMALNSMAGFLLLNDIQYTSETSHNKTSQETRPSGFRTLLTRIKSWLALRH